MSTESMVTQAEVDAALEIFNGGLVLQTDERNERGYTIFYRPAAAMQAVLENFATHRTAAQPEREANGERCQDCGCAYEIVYRVPDDVWTQIAPDKAGLGDSGHQYGGLLCPACANRRARELGIYLYFDASVGDWQQEREAVLEEAAKVVESGHVPGFDNPQTAQALSDMATAIRALKTTPTPAVSTDEIVAELAVEFYGPCVEKALSLLKLVASERGCMDAEDERLNPFCDDLSGGDDTINLCFDAGLLVQRGSDDNFTCELTAKGRAILSRIRGEGE